MLGELLQNARRAQARHILIEADDRSITVTDDGVGISDLQCLIFIAESGWDSELQQRENAFGMGALSTLYFAEHLSVHSGHQSFRARTAAILNGEDIEVLSAAPRIGTEIRLDGVQSHRPATPLPDWARQELERLCEAFPVRVSFNGIDLPRPLADPALSWRETDVGRVLLNLAGSPHHWRCFLHGLPIGRRCDTSEHQVVCLRDDMIARLPDRQHLLNEESDCRRIQTAINQTYRQALLEAKERLGPRAFIERYGANCLDSSNADLLNDVRFALGSWFRDWEGEPPGHRPYWERATLDGLIADDSLIEGTVWCIEADEDDAPTAEVYLCARNGYLLEEYRLDSNHWLMQVAKPLSPDQVLVQNGDILHEDSRVVLGDGCAELVLVDSLRVSLNGEPGEHAVTAVRKGNKIYLTDQAVSVTRLVCDYVFDDRYSESSKSDDEQTIDRFIAVGSSQGPGQVICALLPDSLSYVPQPKLAGATVRLVFDEEGKLQTVTT